MFGYSNGGGDDNGSDALTAVGIVFVLTAALFIPMFVALLLFLVLRRLGFGVGEWLMLFAAGVAMLILAAVGPATPAADYVRWLASIPTERTGALLYLPVTFIAAVSAVLAGFIGTVSVGKIGDWPIPGARFIKRIPNFLFGRAVHDENPWAPSDKQRKQVRDHAMDGGPAPSKGGLAFGKSTAPKALRGPAGVSSPLGNVTRDGEIILGWDRDGAPSTITWDALNVHTAILGSTGSGKTTLLSTLIAGVAMSGQVTGDPIDVIVVDLKEDLEPGGLRDQVVDLGAALQMQTQWTAISDPNPQTWFSPLDGLTPDAARDAVLSIQGGDDDNYWASLSRRVLGQAITLITDAHRLDPHRFAPLELYTLGQLLMAPGGMKQAAQERMVAVMQAMPNREKTDFNALIDPSPDEAKNARGFGAKITQFYESQAGRVALRPSGGRPMMDAAAPGLVYVGADGTAKPELSRVMSSAVLLRVAGLVADATSGQRGGPRRRKLLVIDEAGSADPKLVDPLLKRARSAGIGVVLASQSSLDWRDGPEDLWPNLAANLNNTIVMKQNQDEAAEAMADFLGQYERQLIYESTRIGRAMEGHGQLRPTLDYRVPIEDLRQLESGEAWVRTSSPDVQLRWTQVQRTAIASTRRPAYA